MKVIEEGTDRKAEVHLHAKGVVDALDEYGQYIDEVDNAICCFVPVEEGQNIKISGKFNGTVMNIQYDVSIDGVCRKANSYLSKAVTVQRNKKLEFEKFLFQSKDGGALDTELIVTKIPSVLDVQENKPSTVGTIEMRVCVERRFGDTHTLRDVPLYYECNDEGYNLDKPVGYKTIKPELAMTYEKDCAPLDGRKSKGEKKKINAARPGKETWAIFRFYYRTIDSIEEAEMDITFEGSAKDTSDPHILNIEKLPLLTVGAKPGKTGDAEETSTRHSTPAPSVPDPVAPKTPTRQPATEASAQPRTAQTTERSPSPTADTTAEDLARLQRSFVDTAPTPVAMAPLTHAPDEGKPAEDPKKAAETENATAVPAKRPAPGPTPPISPVPAKRPHLTITSALITPPDSASPGPNGLERKVAEMRRRLAEAKEKRQKNALKQQAVNEKLAPYQERLAEEFSKLEKMVAEEEGVKDQEEMELLESEKILTEFQGDSD